MPPAPSMRRAFRFLRLLLEQALRARTLAVLAIFAALSAAMLWWARGAAQYAQNLALNLAAEFVGAFVILFALTPIVRRAQQGGVREHRRLDFDWYIDRVIAATMSARVLHTFSRLFAPPFDRRFLQAAAGLLRRQGRVQVLLLHPDSPAAAQRTAELRGQGDVGRRARGNLRALDAFRRGLDERLRPRFEVRLYTTSPSVQIYQWDDRLLASFLPVGRLSGDNAQLEISAESPLGDFVVERFEELWRQSISIDDYMSVQVTVSDGTGDRDYSSPFVTLDGEHYLAGPQVIAHLARCRPRVVRAVLSTAPERTYLVDTVAEESTVTAEVNTRFLEKYDRPEPAFVRLSPEDPRSRGGR